jgi:single-strand DNA-binding protein
LESLSLAPIEEAFMSEGLNMVTLLGNLGADPELTQTSGGPRLKMRLATTEVYFDKEKQRQERTEWHTVKVFGRRAEGLAKILSKGDRLFLQGRIETSSYEKNGEKRSNVEIIANDFRLLGGPRHPRDPLPREAPTMSAGELPF